MLPTILLCLSFTIQLGVEEATAGDVAACGCTECYCESESSCGCVEKVGVQPWPEVLPLVIRAEPDVQRLRMPRPVARIDGPPAVRVGDMVILDASHSLGALTYTWRLEPAVHGLIIFDNGKRIAFSNASPGVYLFILAVGGEGSAPSIAVHTVELGQPEMAVVQEAPSAQVSVPQRDIPAEVASWLNLVESPNRNAEARVLAGSFRQVVALIRTGVIRSPDDISAHTGELAKGALGDAIVYWAPWFSQLTMLLDELKSQGILESLDHYENAWLNVARVLESN